MIDYSPLWETMAHKGIAQYQILKGKAIDNKTFDSLKKGGDITLLTVERLCKYLEYTPNDIVSFKD